MSTSRGNHFEQGKLVKRKKTWIFDLDGTLADTEDYEAHHKVKDEGFNTEARNAPVNEDIKKKMEKAKKKDKNVVILTARSAHYRDTTKKWLHENNVQYDALIMRPTDDNDTDRKVKKDLLDEDIMPHYNVTKAWDDKKKNVKMFKKRGIDAKHVK